MLTNSSSFSLDIFMQNNQQRVYNSSLQLWFSNVLGLQNYEENNFLQSHCSFRYLHNNDGNNHDLDVAFVTTEVIICMVLDFSCLFTVRSIAQVLYRASRYCISGIPLIYAHGLLTLKSLHKWMSNNEMIINKL